MWPRGQAEPRPGPHLLLQGLPHLLDACAFDEVWQLEGGLFNASFALQVLALKTPMAWHRHGIPSGLEMNQKLGVLCCHIVHLHNIGTSHELKKMAPRLNKAQSLWPKAFSFSSSKDPHLSHTGHLQSSPLKAKPATGVRSPRPAGSAWSHLLKFSHSEAIHSAQLLLR